MVHRVFLGDYVKIYDASDPNLYMVTGVTWFPLTAKKRRAEPPTPVLFSPSRPLLRTQCELSFAGARGGPRRSLTKAFNKTECMPVAGCALQADLCPPPHPHPSGPPRGTQALGLQEARASAKLEMYQEGEGGRSRSHKRSGSGGSRNRGRESTHRSDSNE